MKLALFDTDAAFDGAQRFLLDFARGLLTRHWEILAILGTDGPLVGQLRAAGIEVIVEPLAEEMRNLRSVWLHPVFWRDAWRLSRHLKGHSIDVLYANSTLAAFLGSMAGWPRRKTIWRLHRPIEAQSAPLHLLCGKLLWQTHVPFGSTRDALRLLVGDRPSIHVVPYGLAPQPPTAQQRKTHEPPTIGMYGAWMQHQGHDVLARAFRLLQEQGQRAQLRLGGPADTTGQQRVRAMVLSSIKATGYEERVRAEEIDDIPQFFRKCDIVVIPSLRDGNARKALEASAAGCPVVATRVASMAEIVEDGHTGLLVQPNNHRALADALALLLASAALRGEMGHQARVRVEERFSIAAMLDAFERIV